MNWCNSEIIKLKAQILINQLIKHREIENCIRLGGEKNYEGNLERKKEGIRLAKQILSLTKYNLNLD